MSLELCIVCTVRARARKNARWVGGWECWRKGHPLYCSIQKGVARWVCGRVSVYCFLIHAMK